MKKWLIPLAAVLAAPFLPVFVSAQGKPATVFEPECAGGVPGGNA